MEKLIENNKVKPKLQRLFKMMNQRLFAGQNFSYEERHEIRNWLLTEHVYYGKNQDLFYHTKQSSTKSKPKQYFYRVRYATLTYSGIYCAGSHTPEESIINLKEEFAKKLDIQLGHKVNRENIILEQFNLV